MDYSNCVVLVNTSDKYTEAIRPLILLIKKYWPEHPSKIYINYESKGDYTDPDCNIIAFHEYNDSTTWSKRLLNCLENIKEDYIVFMLEDFFLLDYVKNDVLLKCLSWMEKYPEIAVCRLKSSAHPLLTVDERFDDFRVAGSDVGYRLETQTAIWRKKDLMAFIDVSESPWGFEEKGTLRIKNTEKLFLWHYVTDEVDLTQMIYPYHITQTLGYGIAWGKWLWNNKAWFEKNGIYGVQFKKLGCLSEKKVKIRIRYLYRVGLPAPKGMEWIIYQVLQMAGRIDRFYRLLRYGGFKKAFRFLKKKLG